jgi:UDP:flavonoid glycosyltransferase YjiC (YdhE family)
MAGRRILFNILSGSGHLHAVTPLALALQARGHDVRIGVAGNYARAVRAAGLMPVTVGEDWGDPVDINPGFLQLPSHEQLRWTVGRTTAPSAQSLARLVSEWRPDVIIRDGMSYAPWLVGEETGIPVLLFGSTGIMPRPLAQFLLGELLAELRASRGLPPDPELAGLHGVMAIDTTPPSLYDAFAGMVTNRQPLRPLQWTGDAQEAPAWLASLGNRPLVYATLGTVVNRNPEVFRKLVAAVTGMDVDLVMTIGRNGDVGALGDIPTNVHVAPYIPQDRVLEMASAVVCHAGRGTTYGALEAGLPLCLLPLGTDQPLVASAVEKAGAGIICGTTTLAVGPMQLPVTIPADLDVATLRGAIERTLTDPGLRQRAGEIATEIAGMPSPEEVAEKVEAVAAGEPALA